MRRLIALSCVLVACGSPPPVDAGVTLPDAATDAGVDAGEPPLEPDLVCPGDPSCPDEGDGVLYAGAAAIPITPSFDDVDAITLDVDGDGVFEPEDGDTFEDRDGDGDFDAIWLAGFGNGRGATSILNDTWARAIALRQNETTVVFVALDVVGFFLDDAEPIRELVSDLEVDYVSVSATHDHEGYDTIGIWGPSLDVSGRDPRYIERVQAQAAQAVRDAVAALEPAHVQYASLRVRDVPGGLLRIVGDSRDPQILDDEARVMRFERPADGTTISTLINFAAHPEYMGSSNTALSSDYPHWLREGVESGVEGPDGTMAEGVGGICVFVNGALGAQIGPGRAQVRTWADEPVPRGSEQNASTMGSQLAWHVLQALGPEGGSTTEETADLAVRRARFFIKIENRRYHVAYLQGLFVREVYHFDPDYPIRPGTNEPDVLSEIAVIDVGRATMITIPGELDPALFVGGYDGSYTPEGVDIVDTSRTNPPDLSRAPSGPYLRDLARADADQVWLLGLTNDFLGYFLPEFDYQLDPGLPYIGEAPGAHYEETNSIGISGWPRVEDQLHQLLAWTR
ncbi:MAG: hypothetical protein H6719_00680 [Sandaracinaceae bacterium]|nr:hypothetical protein [Sandaracinaceae bacterium]